jgi:hypothetical protein
MAAEREDDGVVRAWGGGVVPVVLGALAIVYLAAVWSEAAIRSGLSLRWLPAPIAYLTQIAALFPSPTAHAIDYRAEGFRCRDKTWVELDVSPWFPIDADNKESRFYRALHFYGEPHGREDEESKKRRLPALKALDDFIVTHADSDAVDAVAQGRGGDPIGGVRFTRISVPIGKPGDGSPRYQKTPLADHPPDQRHELYATPKSKREERCARIGL